MAESSDENNKPIPNKLADDLDSMLDETEASMEQQPEELIDDEDAIDRLLMDNAFDNADEEVDEFAEIDELIDETFDHSDNRPVDDGTDIVDEFADDDDLVVMADTHEPQDKIDNTPEVDEFAGIDDTLTNDEVELKKSAELFQEEMEEVNKGQTNEQDLSDDFDISADEPDFDPESEPPAETTSVDKSSEVDSADHSDDKQNESAITELYAQLASIKDEQVAMVRQIAEVGRKDNSAALVDELEGLQGEQKKLKHKLNTVENKKPVIAYAALAVAVFALLLGGGLGVVGFGADSKVTELTDSMVDIEESLEILTEENVIEKIKVLSHRLDKMASDVAENSTRLTSMKKAVEVLSNQSETKSLSQQLAQLDNESMQIGTAIESLQLQIDALENKKKGVRRKAVIKKKWVVNLISFKQEWYAKRKAAEFEKKGIPVEVTKVVIKGKTWYRLRVKGFNSKYEAAAYAAKVKKSLNLTSVWVTTG